MKKAFSLLAICFAMFSAQAVMAQSTINLVGSTSSTACFDVYFESPLEGDSAIYEVVMDYTDESGATQGYGKQVVVHPGDSKVQTLTVINLVPATYNVRAFKWVFNPGIDLDEQVDGAPVQIATTSSISESQTASPISLYPNPVADFVTIEGTQLVGETLTILDLTGKIVLNQKVTNEKLQVDVTSLSPGTYIVRISNGKGIKRFIKQ